MKNVGIHTKTIAGVENCIWRRVTKFTVSTRLASSHTSNPRLKVHIHLTSFDRPTWILAFVGDDACAGSLAFCRSYSYINQKPGHCSKIFWYGPCFQIPHRKRTGIVSTTVRRQVMLSYNMLYTCYNYLQTPGGKCWSVVSTCTGTNESIGIISAGRMEHKQLIKSPARILNH